MAYSDATRHHPANHGALVHSAGWHAFLAWCRSVVNGETTVSFLFAVIVIATALVFLVPMMAF